MGQMPALGLEKSQDSSATDTVPHRPQPGPEAALHLLERGNFDLPHPCGKTSPWAREQERSKEAETKAGRERDTHFPPLLLCVTLPRGCQVSGISLPRDRTWLGLGMEVTPLTQRCSNPTGQLWVRLPRRFCGPGAFPWDKYGLPIGELYGSPPGPAGFLTPSSTCKVPTFCP